MKKNFACIFMLVCLILCGAVMMPNQAGAAQNTYWIAGATKGMANKVMKVSYDGYDLYVSGYAGRASTKTKALNKKKIKVKKNIRISKRCKILSDSGSESIKKVLQKNRKGVITGFVELKIENGQIIKIQYGC